MNICECMSIQQADGSEMCRICRGDIYGCECDLVHSLKCEDHPINQQEPTMNLEDGIFLHECETPGCTSKVEFDDEPYCFTHSPDEGSSVLGYSARAEANKRKRE